MSVIRAIYGELPTFPATDQHPDAVRYFVSPVWVDAIGGAPTQQEIDAILNPPDSARVAGLKSDVGLQDLLTRLGNSTVPQIDAWLAANVTTLGQARTVLAAVIKVLALKLGV